jgi:hypothetical protein
VFERLTAHRQRQALKSSEVWEIRRNVLDRLMRLPSQRHRFESEYREKFPRPGAYKIQTCSVELSRKNTARLSSTFATA